MSMRRSRLQVKPNIGASKSGARTKADDKSKLCKPTTRESLKSPERPALKSAQQSKDETHADLQNTMFVEKGLVPNEIQIQNQSVTINNRTSIRSFPRAVKSPVHKPEQNFESTCISEDLTKIKSRTDFVECRPDASIVGDAMAKSPQTEKTNVTDISDKPNSKPTSKLRSRFIRKVKPNLLEAGKSRNRKTVSSVGDVPKPATQVTPNTSTLLQPVTQEQVDETSTPVVEATPTSTDLSLRRDTEFSRVNDGPEVAAEVMVAAEVECPAMEDDLEHRRAPSRDLSPSSVADSSIYQNEDCSIFPSQPEPVHKPVKQRTKVLAPIDKPPDKCKMLMKDLIYWNPINNPMKVKEKKSTSSEKSSESVLETSRDEEPPAELPDPEEEEEKSLPVPQVKIGPDGSIILNEESLVIDRKSDQSELSDIGVLDETDAVSSYSSFRTRHLSKTWSDKETERFFYALSVVGTDFSMMCNLFKRRNRYDLKKKFKREEKHNRPLVDKALRERKTFDMSLFENISDEEDIEAKEKKKEKKRQGRKRDRGKKKADEEETMENNKPGRKKKTPKQKKRNSQYFCEDSDEEEELADGEVVHSQITSTSPVPEATGEEEKLAELEEREDDGKRTIARKDEGNSSDEDELDVMNSMCQTTRSGRVPKRTSLYNVNTESPRKRSKKETSVSSTDPLEGGGPENRASRQPALPAGGAQGTSVTAANEECMEIHTVQNIPTVGGSQIVLVTQKGQDSSGQGTVIHVYMLSPTASRTPEWSGRASPRVNPHVYTASPRPHGSDWTGGTSPRFPSASPRPPVPEWPTGNSPKPHVYSAIPKLPVSVPCVQKSDTGTLSSTITPDSRDVFSSSVNTDQAQTSTNTEDTLDSEQIISEDAISKVIAEEIVT